MNEHIEETRGDNATDYTYDANNRMTSAITSSNGNITDKTDYIYDNNGNTISEQKKDYTNE